jgi:hypothetical protein
VEASSAGLLSASAPLGTTFITSVSPSAVASQRINSCFSAAYENYLVVARLSQSADAALALRVRVGGVDASGASDYYSNLTTSTTAVPALTQSGSTALTSIVLGSTIGATRTDAVYLLWFGAPFATDETVVHVDGSWRHTIPGVGRVSGAGLRNATTSYDGFSIIPNSGTITGTIKVYGLRDS